MYFTYYTQRVTTSLSQRLENLPGPELSVKPWVRDRLHQTGLIWEGSLLGKGAGSPNINYHQKKYISTKEILDSLKKKASLSIFYMFCVLEV